MIVVAVLVQVFVTQPSAADPISDKKKEAARLADRIEQLTTRAEQLAEQYNQAAYDLEVLDAQVHDAEKKLALKRVEISVASSKLSSVALHVFAHPGETDPLLSVLDSGAGASDSALRAGLNRLAVGEDQRAADELRRGREDAQAGQADLEAKRREQATAKSYLSSRRKDVEGATTQVQQLLTHAKGDLARLLRQEQERRAAAEAAAVRARLAQRRSSSTGSTGTSAGPARVVRQPPAPSAGAAGAVEAAMSQIGVRYQWGGASPETGFDCSGLTMWAWARAGRPGLPHFARAQWEGLPHVNIEDLQPGDLVFFGASIHHMGMYVGGGTMVNAPRTDDVVKISSIYRSDLIGAARP
ncbi:MAG: NlpC/P60 family protein [Acidimicrobiales bacterium]